ncbi:MAG TPA: metallophosphoesterase [Pirellulales bacterium]|jgi:hypothetical protein|nr:metallophosphoesterase [Pirellulales bacterium]
MAISTDQVRSVIDCYQAAALANQNTPSRSGNVVNLTAEIADECLVTGDVHGHVANFDAILRLADLERFPRRHLVLQEVCHGGPLFPNGGCKSFRLLERVARLKTEYPDRVHFLLSNHELAELTDYPILKAKRMLNLTFRMGLQEEYGDAADQVREAYCQFIGSCPLGVRLASGVFISHSLPEHLDHHTFDRTVLDRPYEPQDLREHGPVFDLVWGRDHRPDNAHAFSVLVGSKVLVHGHEPCREGFGTPNDTQLILDCCGDVACYVLLPVGGSITHAEALQCVQRLTP